MILPKKIPPENLEQLREWAEYAPNNGMLYDLLGHIAALEAEIERPDDGSKGIGYESHVEHECNQLRSANEMIKEELDNSREALAKVIQEQKGICSTRGVHEKEDVSRRPIQAQQKTEFQIGDIVECAGVRGTVVSVSDDDISDPVEVRFEYKTFESFTLNGRTKHWHLKPSLILIERPKKKVIRKGWINAYPSETSSHSGDLIHKSKEDADKCASPDRIACIPIEYEVK
jgi:hypothetical protein